MHRCENQRVESLSVELVRKNRCLEPSGSNHGQHNATSRKDLIIYVCVRKLGKMREVGEDNHKAFQALYDYHTAQHRPDL